MLTRPDFDAVLFDLDGVLTATAGLHAAAWKQTFDPVLADARAQPPVRPRSATTSPTSTASRARTACATSSAPAGSTSTDARAADRRERKQRAFEAALRDRGIEAFAGSVRWVRRLRAEGVHTAVVSSSANARAVLHAAGIETLFDLTIDGGDVTRLGLRGKPAPDGFLEAAAPARRTASRPSSSRTRSPA